MRQLFLRYFPPTRIKRRLWLLVVIVVLPVTSVLVWNIVDLRNVENENALGRVERLGSRISSDYDLLLHLTEQILFALSDMDFRTAALRSECSLFLQSLHGQYELYDNFVIVGTDGRVRCSADSNAQNDSYADSQLYQTVISEKKYAVGEYEVNNNGSESASSIDFGYPIIRNGMVTGIILATASHDFLLRTIQNADLPEGSTVTIVDRNGMVLFRNPMNELVGTSVHGTELGELIYEEDNQATARLHLGIGLDGIERLYSFKSSTITSPDPDIYVAVGIPVSVVYAESNALLLQELAVLIAVAVMTYFFAQILGRNLLLREVDALTEADRLKSELVSFVSHQIKNPLSSIKLNAELLNTKTLGREEKEIVARISKASDDGAKLAIDFLDQHRLEITSMHTQHVTVDLNEIAKASLHDIAQKANKKNLHVDASFTQEQVIVNADPDLLRQVIDNFLSNAVKYTPKGKSITLVTKRDGNEARLEVSDSGIGIPEAELGNMFQPFFRHSEAERLEPGTGMGLFFAKKIIELSGGKIGVDSKESEGSTFWFTLPSFGRGRNQST